MVKDPAIETLDKIIEGFELLGGTVRELYDIHIQMNKLVLDLEERVRKLEEYRQLINDNMEQTI
jgi:hypothetical protein